MPLATAPARPRATVAGRSRGRSSTLLLTVLLVVVAAATVGVVRAVDLVRTRDERSALAGLADPATPGLKIGEPVRTSFGAMTVREATVDNGLSAEELGGMSHGVSSLVAQGHAEVNVLVTLNNTSSRPVLVQASQFRLLTGRGGRTTGSAAASGTTLQAGLLPGRSVVDARVTVVTATDGSQLWLEYADPGRPAPMRISLGTTDNISKSSDGHEH